MSLAQVRAALETQLATVAPTIDTAYENRAFMPVADTPYQQVTLLPAAPNNAEIGPAWTEQGMFAVNLFYPKDQGAGAAIARAELIRAAFVMGSSFVSGGVTVNITTTPAIGVARPDDDRFMVPVRVNWIARIGG